MVRFDELTIRVNNPLPFPPSSSHRTTSFPSLASLLARVVVPSYLTPRLPQAALAVDHSLHHARHRYKSAVTGFICDGSIKTRGQPWHKSLFRVFRVWLPGARRTPLIEAPFCAASPAACYGQRGRLGPHRGTVYPGASTRIDSSMLPPGPTHAHAPAYHPGVGEREEVDDGGGV
ncbi:hypothetical protein DFH06DRAFT_1340829 [Mycena polygramma]|nr:hypothetical protein DFH06DRAFT_1340829 [Mycena polygramma]